MTCYFDKLPDCVNLGLCWDKYFFLESKNRNFFLKSKAEESERNLAMELLRRLNNKLSYVTKLGSFDVLHRRRDNLIAKLEPKMSKVCDFNLKLKGRLLVGSGNPSPIEVGMTFSRNYGIPVIPNSAIKGSLGHYLKSNGLLGEYFKDLFGEDTKEGEDSENIRGCLIFLEAIPKGDLKFDVDIVNNHFQPYYMNSDRPPNDWYNPVPVTYITVLEETFRFTLLKDNTQNRLSNEIFAEVSKHLKQMLSKSGIGAKTNYGYGRFKISGVAKVPGSDL